MKAWKLTLASVEEVSTAAVVLANSLEAAKEKVKGHFPGSSVVPLKGAQLTIDGAVWNLSETRLIK